MTLPELNPETIDLLNEALSLPYRDSVRRKQLVFRLNNLLRINPKDYRVKIVLGQLYGDDGETASAITSLNEININSIAGDAASLGAYANLALSLFDRDKTKSALRMLYGMKAGRDVLEYASYAAHVGDVQLLVDLKEGEGRASALSADILNILKRGGVLESFEDHQKVVWNTLRGNYSVQSNMTISGDPEASTLESDGITFIHRFNLPFSRRLQIQRDIREKLGSAYLAAGKSRYSWIGCISHVIAFADDAIDRAA